MKLGGRTIGITLAILAGLFLISLRIFSTFYASAQTPPPTVSASANPSTITLGESTTITWSSTNANSCTASGNIGGTGAIPTSGSFTVTPPSTGSYTYTITCTGSGGSASTNFVLSPTSPSAAVTPACPASGCPTTPVRGPTVVLSTSTCTSQHATVATILGGATGNSQSAIASLQALGCTVNSGVMGNVPYVMVTDPANGATVGIFIGPQI